MALDYKDKRNPLSIGRRKVDSFCMTGLAAEFGFSVSHEVGCSTLAARHMPTSLELNLDHRGKTHVLLHDENRSLGVKVAKHVRCRLHSFGLEFVDAQVEVHAPTGKKLGEHDMVMELVAEDGAEAATGFFSVELRCRRVWSENGLKHVRRVTMNECCLKCGWWVAEKQRRADWAGRVLVLCVFGRTGEDFVSRADVQLGDQAVRGLWGWQGSVGSLRPSASAPAAPLLFSAPPPPRRSAPRSATRPVPQKRKKPWEECEQELQQVFRKEKRVQVAPVRCLFEALDLNRKRMCEKVDAFRERHSLDDRACFKAPRVGIKLGGSEEWVATATVLQQMHDEL